MCRGALTLTHLLFVDDYFLFCKVEENVINKLKEIININYQKSEIFYSTNTPQHLKDNISTIKGITQTIGSSNYLGLPSIIGRKKIVVFGFFKDRLLETHQSLVIKATLKRG